MEMKLGLEAGEFTLELAVELGIRGVPIDGEQLVEKGAKSTLAPLEERGLTACQIGAFGYNPLSSDVSVQARNSEMLKRIIPLAAETGCAYITIGPGNYHPSAFGIDDPRNHRPEALNVMALALEPLLELATEHRVNLTFEPYLKGAINSAKSFLDLWSRIPSPNLRANVDPSSLYHYGDLLDARGKVEEVCTGLAGHYGLVHLKEIALKEGFHIQAGMVPLGKGPTDWAQLFRLVEPHVPRDGWVILEHVGSPEEGRASFQLLREAAAQAGVMIR